MFVIYLLWEETLVTKIATVSQRMTPVAADFDFIPPPWSNRGDNSWTCDWQMRWKKCFNLCRASDANEACLIILSKPLAAAWVKFQFCAHVSAAHRNHQYYIYYHIGGRILDNTHVWCDIILSEPPHYFEQWRTIIYLQNLFNCFKKPRWHTF